MEKNNNKPKLRFPGFTDPWEQRKLGELGEVITGSTPSTQVQAYYSDDGIPWVTPTDISDNVTYCTAKHLSEEGQKVARVVPQNTVLVTSIASIGKNTMLGTTGSFNQQINGLVPNEKENYPYFLFTESALWSKKMKRSAAAGTMQIVNKMEFSKLKTNVPTLTEQRQIGNFFNNLDNLITLHQRKLNHLQDKKKSLLQKMFPKNGENFPELRFPEFTDPWKQHKFGEIGTVQTCKRIFKEQTSESGDIPFYKNGTLGLKADAYISREVFEEYKELYPYPRVGDVLISVVGSIGRTAEYKGNAEYFQDSNIVWLKADNNIIDKKFLKISYQIIDWLIEGSTIKHLYNDNILASKIWIPSSIDEQKAVGGFFDFLDNLITLHQRKLNHLQEQKKALLQQMFV